MPTRPGTRRTSGRPSRAGRSRASPGPYAAALDTLDGAGDTATLALDGAAVTVTHLDKVLWPPTVDGALPAYTRRDHVRYLLCVAPFMLPHVRDRPLTLIRQPGGVNARRFVHFHYEQPLPAFVDTIDIYSAKAGTAEPYVLCNNAATLVWLAHVGSLEIHPWHSRGRMAADAKGAGTAYAESLAGLAASVLNRPDFLVCDLDPYVYAGTEAAGAQPEFNETAWRHAKEVALVLKSLLDAMGVQAIVKTSGKTGLHVLVPIVRTLTYDETRAMAFTIGRHLAQQRADLVTLDQKVTGREGRIFFDYGMNARVKTLIAPYSTRGVPGAPVAMPVDWADLPDAAPLDYTMANVPDILAAHGDLWQDVLAQKQDLARIIGAR